MRVTDPLGNELQALDAVVIDLPQVIGVIQKVDTGELVKGLILDGKPTGQQTPPHVIIHVQMTVPVLIQTLPGAPVGQVPGVVKIAKPAKENE